MTDAARIARNEVQREWRKKNPEKVRAAQARYWERKAEKMKNERQAQGNGSRE